METKFATLKDLSEMNKFQLIKLLVGVSSQKYNISIISEQQRLFNVITNRLREAQNQGDIALAAQLAADAIRVKKSMKAKKSRLRPITPTKAVFIQDSLWRNGFNG